MIIGGKEVCSTPCSISTDRDGSEEDPEESKEALRRVEAFSNDDY